MNELLTKIGAGTFYGLITGIAATVILNFIYEAFILPFKRRDLLVKAEQQGRKVKGNLIKTNVTDNSFYRKQIGGYIGYYQYSYKGKEYRYVLDTVYSPDSEIDLYILDNPKKAQMAGEFGKSTILKWIIFLATFLIVYLVSFFKF